MEIIRGHGTDDRQWTCWTVWYFQPHTSSSFRVDAKINVIPWNNWTFVGKLGVGLYDFINIPALEQRYSWEGLMDIVLSHCYIWLWDKIYLPKFTELEIIVSLLMHQWLWSLCMSPTSGTLWSTHYNPTGAYAS